MSNKLPLTSVRIRNFKSIRDTGKLDLGDLTVLIGRNGSGKSSFIEGLRFMRDVCVHDLEEAVSRWKSIENIRNRAVERKTLQASRRGREHESEPIEFNLDGYQGSRTYGFKQSITRNTSGDQMFILDESLQRRAAVSINRDAMGTLKVRDTGKAVQQQKYTGERRYDDGESVVQHPYVFDFRSFLKHWQFMELNPAAMGELSPHRRAGKDDVLHPTGKNIASYLLSMAGDPAVLNGIVETVGNVLGYVTDLQPKLTSEYERLVYLQLTEGKMKLPSWLLSSGTLRLVSLLAVLRNPEPSPVIFIEEIENGLDPGTIHMIMSEIQEFTAEGKGQVILTTHSPYLLDLSALKSILICERTENGPTFRKPVDDEAVREWAKRFAPGKLYTMGKFRGGA